MSAGYKTGSNRKQHVGIDWLGCCLGACAPSVTLESPHDRCSSLMSLKGRIRVFFFFFFVFFPQGQPRSIHPTHGSVLQSWNKWHSTLQRMWSEVSAAWICQWQDTAFNFISCTVCFLYALTMLYVSHIYCERVEYAMHEWKVKWDCRMKLAGWGKSSKILANMLLTFFCRVRQLIPLVSKYSE